VTPADQQEALRELIRGSFPAFVRKVFHEVNPTVQFFDALYLDALMHGLELCRTRAIKRLIITMPPRSLKSIVTSVAFPAFLLGHNPAERILCISYAHELAQKHARDFRSVVESSWYGPAFPKTVALRNVEEIFETTRHGYRRSGSFAGGQTGLGANIIIVDDAIKADEALSKSAREKTNDLFANTLYSRLDHKIEGVIIVVMQRLHDDDLVGHVLRQGGWHHLNFPAIAVKDESIPIGNGELYHRKKGEVLNPAFEPLSSLEETRRMIGTMNFEAQYQGSPIPDAGNLIKREWFHFYQSQPPSSNARLVQSWDTANKGEEVHDYSVGTTWLYSDGKHFLIDLIRRQCDYPTLSKLVLEQCSKYKPDALLIEDHGSGSALIADLKERSSINAIPIMPTGDKVTRLSIVSPMFERGEIFVPQNAPWLMEFMDELLRFPQARFDDQVDSVTQYLNWHRNCVKKDEFDVFWT
jgi:predicted phage terminase large subunit-like protein